MKNSSTLHYFTAGALVTVIMLLIYATVQQSYRTGLNDPQVQIARDISNSIQQGRQIEPVMAGAPFDISQSLSPFVVLYDAAGKAVRSNALLNGKMPQVPVGLFDEVRKNSEHRVSWQPRKGVRMAMVIVKTNNPTIAFVAAGRSMKETEDRIQKMMNTVFIAWVACIGIIIITAIIQSFMKQGKIIQKLT